MNKDGEIFTSKFKDGKYKVILLDENDFRKKDKFLARYCRRTYKHLNFEVLRKLKYFGDSEGYHYYKLPVEPIFNKVYGELELIYSVHDKIILIEDIRPGDILISGYMNNLKTYKGIPYRDDRDLAKIKLAWNLERR